MIPTAFLTEWSASAPWPDLRQVEQDLIISRALCDLFNCASLKGKIAFRGGTAINKLLFERPLRYSEDIDLVQIQAEPVGSTVDAIRHALSWLGKCSRTQAGHSMHLVYKFSPESDGSSTLKLKIEINTRDHESYLGFRNYAFGIVSGWYAATTSIVSFEPEEIFGTKLRALLQRQKSRDLFDLYEGLLRLNLDTVKLVACLQHYLAREETSISRANAEQVMLKKLNRRLSDDIAPLLPPTIRYTEDDALRAFGLVWNRLIQQLDGEPWKLSEKTIAEIREKKFPNLLAENE